MDEQQIIDITPIGLMFLVLMGMMMFALPLRFALLPIVLTSCWMTWGQQAVVAHLHFTILRVMVMVGYCRVVVRQDFRKFQWNRLDGWVVLWGLSGITAYTLLLQTGDALINRLGVAYNSVGLYFLFRFFVRDEDDLKRLCRMFSLALVPVALCMCFETATGRNVFYFFGGVPEFSTVRSGIVRCQGPFRHPILAGTFGATLMPLFAGLWWQGRLHRNVAFLGLCAATVVTALSGSTGPILTYVIGLIALCARPLQAYMRTVRWTVLLSIVTLQMIMKQPVWFIFARINILSGSTGWHRSNLIDQTIRHMSEWWLIGTALENVGNWGVWWGDITNQYILEGITGGLVTLLLFITIIVVAFSQIGKLTRALASTDKPQHRLLWSLGVALCSHVVAFLSVSYFDQNLVSWYLLLAVVASIATSTRRGARWNRQLLSGRPDSEKSLGHRTVTGVAVT